MRSKRHTETADMILSQVSTDNLATLVAIQEPVRIDDYSLQCSVLFPLVLNSYFEEFD